MGHLTLQVAPLGAFGMNLHSEKSNISKAILSNLRVCLINRLALSNLHAACLHSRFALVLGRTLIPVTSLVGDQDPRNIFVFDTKLNVARIHFRSRYLWRPVRP